MTKKKKIVLGITIGVSAALVLAVLIPFVILGIRTASINKDYAYLKDNHAFSQKAEVTGVELVKQNVSCGYATIEMISTYYGNKVSEAELDSRNKSISTSTTNGFIKEINKSIPDKKFVKHTYLDNDMLLEEIHMSLMAENPVAIEWAAKYEGEWTLHFSVVTGLDKLCDLH